MGRVPIATIVDAFLAVYEAQVPFREDRVLGSELRTEALPVLETLLEALEHGLSLDQAHEATALVTLLCRRAGLLGATPTAAHAIVEALAAAARSAGCDVPDSLAARLRIVGFEGYCAGRDERLWSESAGMLRASQTPCVLVPRCTAAFLSGRHEPERLAAILDEIGRLALHHDALACLIDTTRLSLCDEHTARALFHGLATLASLGTTPVLCAQAEALAPHLARFGAALPDLQVHASLGDALAAALGEAGYELKPRRRWPKARELFTRGRTSGSRS